MTKLTEYVTKRDVLMSSFARFKAFVDGLDKERPDIMQLTLRVEQIEKLLGEFSEIQTNIELIDKTTSAEQHGQQRELFENDYFKYLSIAKSHIQGAQEKSLPSLPSVSANNEMQNNIRLPTINLPTFDGNYSQWLYFKDTFVSIVNDNVSISQIQKFHYLRLSLKGEAADVVKNLEVSASNYTTAWCLLEGRYNNEVLLVNNHVKALFNLPTVNKESYISLRQLVDGFAKHLRALEVLGQPVESWDTLVNYIILDKLDPTTRRDWECKNANTKFPSTEDLTKFLNERCTLLENLGSSGSKTKSFMSRTSPKCKLCKSNHYLNQCTQFLNLTPEKRFAEVKARNLCSNCLNESHKQIPCRFTGVCKHCKKKHHTLLHFENVVDESQNSNEQLTNDTSQKTVATLSSTNEFGQSLLSTAVVQVKDNLGNFHTCRALLDGGSQSHFCTNELVNKLKLNKTKLNVSVTGINRGLSKIKHMASIKMQSRNNSYTAILNCLVITHITDNVPAVSFSQESLNIPKNVVLADPTFNESGQIDMLIGVNKFWELLQVGQIKLGENLPILQKTLLGWIVAGDIPQTYINCFTTQCNLVSLNEIDKTLSKFWEIEDCGDKMPLSLEEQKAEEFFKTTTQRDQNGRFVVQLPLKLPISHLGESKNTAIKRLKSIETKLNKDPQLKKQYSEFMSEYITLNHMTKLENVSDDGAYYIPHHFVRKDTSITTKLRVVFDASSKSSSGYSVNDLQMVGPSIQQDLFSIITRFRSHKYVLAGDITKMYRQILIHPKDRKLHRIAWRSDFNKEIEYYELNTVTYGTASAPFLAVRCLHELALQNMEEYPQASNIILSDFYVDDLLTGGNDINELLCRFTEISSILNSGGFPLNKWVSNNPEILRYLSDRDDSVIFNIGDDNETYTLGLLWHSTLDQFSYKVKIPPLTRQITKRTILSITSQIFDPLGMVGPVIILGKVLLQKLWQLKLSWDESLPVNLHSEWEQYYSQLPSINDIRFPRYVICKDPVSIELHGFSDASSIAHGACIYIRSCDSSGNYHVNLLCAKSRVNPLKCVTIPRLELCAAVLLARLFERVKSSLNNVSFNNCYFWCDSTIVLAWINASPSTWKVFVANRVSKIQSITSSKDWRHVNGQDNPADIISRGSYPRSLSDLWWHGPSFLKESIDHWPVELKVSPSAATEQGDCTAEMRKQDISLVSITLPSFFRKYSQFVKLQRITAYILRFKHNVLCKEAKNVGPLTFSELDQSTTRLVKLAQQESFSTDLHDIQSKGCVGSKSKLAALNPFVDENGVIRVGGRLTQSDYKFDKRHPSVLLASHPLSKLLAEYEHKKLLHAGAQQLLASLRERFWIVSGRNLIRLVVHDCIKCFRANPKETQYIMADLPANRVMPSPPFHNCGVDYCGPFKIRDRKLRSFKISKGYVCLFICLSTKAIHLELVSDLTTEAFLAALYRFISRRGRCINMYSDNGTNLVGAHAELSKFLSTIKDPLVTALSSEGISWHFIPPRAPNFGGLWEAGVKSFKKHFVRVVGESILTYEEFATVMIQIEACLNSRPMYPLSSDPYDENPLTPAHFLIGHSLTTVPSRSYSDYKEAALSRYKRCQQMFQRFWERWSKEYIGELQVRHKWKQNFDTILQPGSLVIIKEDQLPPLRWQLGRVLQLHPGRDGVTRVVSVKTGSGVYKRPVNKVCVLPDSDET